MKTASELFYRHGIQAVGVDTIASEAGTNKMSFYRNFASKDELVAEYLRSEEREGLLWWDETLAAHAGNPRLQVESLFDVLVKNTCEDDFAGLRAGQCRGGDHRAGSSGAARDREVQGRHASALSRTRARDEARAIRTQLGDSLMLLWEGAYLARVTMGQNGPVQGAAKAARALIAAYTG